MLNLKPMFVEELLKTLSKRQANNPAYSIRAFARDLDINPATLSAIINKKRPLTINTALSLMPKLNWPASTKKKVISSLTKNQIPEKETDFRPIPESHGEVLARWETFAVLSFLEIPPSKFSARELALKLEVPFGEMLVCLGILEQHGYILEKDGKWSLAQIECRASTSDVPNKYLRKGHRSKTQRGLQSLDEDPVEVRDFTDMTMAIDPTKLSEAKEWIRDFRRELCAFLEDGEKKQVYQINIQLFPLSHRSKKS